MYLRQKRLFPKLMFRIGRSPSFIFPELSDGILLGVYHKLELTKGLNKLTIQYILNNKTPFGCYGAYGCSTWWRWYQDSNNFDTHWCTYKFTNSLFGVTIVPAVFNRIISYITMGLQKTEAYFKRKHNSWEQIQWVYASGYLDSQHFRRERLSVLLFILKEEAVPTCYFVQFQWNLLAFCISWR